MYRLGLNLELRRLISVQWTDRNIQTATDPFIHEGICVLM